MGGGDHSSNVSFPSTVVLGGVGLTFVHKENDCSHTVCLKIIKMRLNSTTLPISKEIWVTFVCGSPCYTVLTSAHSFIWWHQMAHIWKCIQILLNLLKWLKKIVILGCSPLFDNGLWRLWRFSSIMEKFCCVLCKCLIQIDYQLLIFQNKLFNVSSLLFYFKKR